MGNFPAPFRAPPPSTSFPHVAQLATAAICSRSNPPSIQSPDSKPTALPSAVRFTQTPLVREADTYPGLSPPCAGNPKHDSLPAGLDGRQAVPSSRGGLACKFCNSTSVCEDVLLEQISWLDDLDEGQSASVGPEAPSKPIPFDLSTSFSPAIRGKIGLISLILWKNLAMAASFATPHGRSARIRRLFNPLYRGIAGYSSVQEAVVALFLTSTRTQRFLA